MDPGSHAVLEIDWKMKWEATSSRETSQQSEHFGKRGIGWHGCLLRFFAYNEEKQEANCLGR